MIVVQSPLRVSLFGGGTDFPSYFHEEGGCVLSTAIDKRIYITAKRRFDRKLRIGYTRTELVDSLDDLQHELIREALRLTGIHESIEISTMADIPTAGSGLGSSSTVTVGALLALHALTGEYPSPSRLAREACKIEIEVLGKPIGVQDQHIAAYGGLRFMEFYPDGRISADRIALDPEIATALNDNLLLFYSGITRKSESVLAEQQDNIVNRRGVLAEIKSLAREARERLQRGDIDGLGELLHESWMCKRQLASRISNGQIEAIYQAARRAGALGGKVTGAGGGGFILLYVPGEVQGGVREALSQLQELPFRFETDGAKVILDYKNGEAVSSRDVRPVTSTSRRGRALLPDGQLPIVSYLSELHRSLDELETDQIQAVIERLHQARLEGRKIFIMGNGGSAATASHFACDLGKNTRHSRWPDFRVMALTDNMATFSALANDEGYENVFVGQIGSLLETGDVAIGISTSGNSPNVVRAMELAKQRGAQTLGFTGFGGGRLGKIVDLNLHVPSENIERVEDTHLILEHLICSALREKAQRNSDLAWRLPRSEADLDSERVRLLYEFNCELAQTNGSKGVLHRTLGLAVSKLRAVSGSVVVIDESGQVAGGSVAYEGQLLERPPELLEDVFRTGLAGWAAREEQAALIPNTQQDARWLRKPWEQSGLTFRSAIAAPVISNGDVLGVITLARPGEAGFTERDLALLKAIALCATLLRDQDGGQVGR